MGEFMDNNCNHKQKTIREKGDFSQAPQKQKNDKKKEVDWLPIYERSQEIIEREDGQEIGKIIVINGSGHEGKHHGIGEQDDWEYANKLVLGQEPNDFPCVNDCQGTEEDIGKAEEYEVWKRENVQKKDFAHEKKIKNW